METLNYKMSQALYALRPKSEWALSNDDYASLQWFDEDSQPPSLKEVQDKIKELDELKANEPQRKAEAAAKLAALGLTLDDLKVLGLA